MLNPKQEEFCYMYIAMDYNARDAYREVYGCREGTLKSKPYELMKKQEIKDKIAEIRKVKLDEMQIDADRVTEKLAEIAFAKKGDDYYKSADQLKALDILSKTLGMQKQKIETKQQEVIEVELK